MRISRYLLALLTLLGLVVLPTQSAAADSGCASLRAPAVPGARVIAFTAQSRPAGQQPGVPAYCDVELRLVHRGEGDNVRVQVWLPATGWNGRFQGTGGAGFSAGTFERALLPALVGGYAAASTDGGIPADLGGPPTWALDEKGRLERGLVRNLAYRSAHDMTVAGKAITAQFYGRPADFSYWNGCSQGGRQGMMEAQRYPRDYDGILAGAPAISWPRFLVGEHWPQVAMQQRRTFPTPCEFTAVHDAVIAACDTRDGVADRVIEEPSRCRFDPRTLIGRTVVCAGKKLTISAADVAVVRAIWDGLRDDSGARLWPGLPKGAKFEALADTVSNPDGSTVGRPFYLTDNWIKYFVLRKPEFDTATLDRRELTRIFRTSAARFDRLLGTDDANLRPFAAAGGKLLVWHGLSDQVIYSDGTERYRERVQRRFGSASTVDRFFRYFRAPGVDHCGGGNGPAPLDPLATLVDWVERGKAPAVLPALTVDQSGATVTRNLCRYPQVSRYNGTGDPKDAASYRCR